MSRRRYPEQSGPGMLWALAGGILLSVLMQLFGKCFEQDVVACRDGYALVHWWYLPDSYDEWIPQAEAADVDEPDKPPKGMSIAVAHALVYGTASAHQGTCVSPMRGRLSCARVLTGRRLQMQV